MTPLERDATKALGQCRFLPGTSAKRFARDLAEKSDDYELSPKQKKFFWFLCWRFRRQLPPEIVKMAELIKAAVTVEAGNAK